MIEIEKLPCTDANEARKRERFWLENLNANINMVIPTRTHSEYFKDNKDQLNENNKKNYFKTMKPI